MNSAPLRGIDLAMGAVLLLGKNCYDLRRAECPGPHRKQRLIGDRSMPLATQEVDLIGDAGTARSQRGWRDDA